MKLYIEGMDALASAGVRVPWRAVIVGCVVKAAIVGAVLW